MEDQIAGSDIEIFLYQVFLCQLLQWTLEQHED